jgi:hypothetical protein
VVLGSGGTQRIPQLVERGIDAGVNHLESGEVTRAEQGETPP